MSDYEQKYLKYKNKYLTLKTQLDEQSGGYYYQDGYYVFFSNQDYSDPANSTVKEDMSFDTFTNTLGTCAMYFRVRSGNSLIDKNNNFETVYPNVSTVTSVATNLFKGAQSITQKVGEASKYIGQKVGEGISYAQEKYNDHKNQAKVGALPSNNQNDEEEKFEHTNPMDKHGGGDVLCPGKPFLSAKLKGGINLVDQVNEKLLKEIVKEIKNNNDKNKTDPTNIESILIVRNKNGKTEVRYRFKVNEVIDTTSKQNEMEIVVQKTFPK